MTKDFDREEYMEAHNDGEFMDRPPLNCPVGERDDCPHFKMESGCANTDEMEWFCEHPDLGKDGDAESQGCPLEWEVEDEDDNG